MKNILRNSNFGFTKWCLSLIAAGWMASTGWGQILTFDFAGKAGSEVSASSNSNNAGLTASSISRGSGITASANADRFNAVDWAVTSIANAVSGSDYMEFTITPNSGKQFSVSSVVVQWQRSATGNTQIALRSSVDNYASDLDTVKSVTDNTSTQTFTWTFTQANKSTPVTYRFYSYGEAVTGSGGPGDGTGNDIVVNGSVSDYAAPGTPTITLNPAAPTLTVFTTTAGTASAAQTFQVTGSNLTEDVTVTAPAGFEVSQDGGSFASNQTLGRSGTTLASKTISVRIAASAAAGSLASANVTLTSTGATTANVAVSGTVSQAGVAPTVTAATIPGTFGVALSANVVASQNPTSYAISSGTLPAGLSLNTTTGAITGTPTAAGTGVVVAVTASNSTGTSAPANLTFDIAKAAQTITGLSTTDSKYTTAPSYSLTATASSGLVVAYTSSNPAVATVSGSTVTIVGAGTTTLTASQAGNNNYNAATNLTQTLTVTVPPMVAWEMTGVLNGGSSPMAPTTVDNRVVVEGLTKGSGIGAVTTGSAWGGNDFMGTDLATAVANNDFATFSVTPASGYQVSLAQIPAYNIRLSSTGPTTGIWQYRKGTGAFTNIGSSITWGTVTSGNYNPQPAIDLSGITDLQNVPAGTTVTFRVVTWSASGTAGTWYINNITGNDLAVLGTISEYTAVVPSLSSFTPAFGATGSTVTISGSNLSAVTGVKFNGQSATFAIQSSSQITATVPAGLQAGKISLIYGSPAAEVLSTTNFEPLDGSGLATVVNGDGTSPYVNTAMFARGQLNNQTLAVTVRNPIVDSTISTIRITLPSDFSLPNSANLSLNGSAGTLSIIGRSLTVEGAAVTSDSPLTVTVSGLSTPDTSASTALDGNYGITVETAGAGGTLASVLVTPTAYVLVPIINLRGVDANGVPTQVGKKVAFEGVVTASGLGSTAGGTKAYVQDPSAAIYIYSAAFTSTPIQGNVYAALGTLTQFRGGTQIDPGTASNLIDRGAGVLPEPTVLTLPISSTVGERYEGSLVKVVGLSRVAGGTGWPAGVTIPMQDSAAATVDLFLQPGSTATTEPATYPATVVGILGQYAAASPFTTGYQLQPRTQADLIFNSAPTDITLSSASFPENNLPNLVVGTLTTTDDNAAGATYTFATGAGDTDNGAFNILGNSLRATAPLDFETQSIYSVLIRVTDAGGLTFTKQFTITVTDVNETPADTTPPVITLIGDNPQLIANGAVYADLGATVTDNVDSTRTIQGTGTVNTAAAGDYTITYNATDAAGNNAVAVSRTVRVAAPLGTTYNSWLGAAPASDAAFWDYVYGATAPGALPASLRPTTVITGGNLVLTYYVRQNTLGLTVTAKKSLDLATGPSGWNIDGVTDQADGAPTSVNGVSVQKRTASVAVSGANKKFLKLEGVQTQ
jgi:hypothetical protein